MNENHSTVTYGVGSPNETTAELEDHNPKLGWFGWLFDIQLPDEAGAINLTGTRIDEDNEPKFTVNWGDQDQTAPFGVGEPQTHEYENGLVITLEVTDPNCGALDIGGGFGLRWE